MAEGPGDRALPELSLIRRILTEAAPGAVDLALGAPTHEVPAAVREALRRPVATEALGYAPNAGLPELRRAVARRRPHHGGGEASVIVTVGSQEALALAILGLADGGEVLVPELAYPSYAALARFAGSAVVAAPPEGMAEALTSRTRLAIVASPANPTGAVLDDRALEKLARQAAERGVHLVSDEVYEELWLRGDRPGHPRGDRVIHLGGVSKSLGAPGLRLGWLIASPPVVERLVPLHQHLVTCAPVLSQRAALAGLAVADEVLDGVREHYRRRWRAAADALRDCLPEAAAWRDPAGAFYVLVDVRPILEETVPFALEQARRGAVLVVPGEAFGGAGAGRLRLSFGGPPDEFREGVRRLGEALQAAARR